jgi:hypothetical protein
LIGHTTKKQLGSNKAKGRARSSLCTREDGVLQKINCSKDYPPPTQLSLSSLPKLTKLLISFNNISIYSHPIMKSANQMSTDGEKGRSLGYGPLLPISEVPELLTSRLQYDTDTSDGFNDYSALYAESILIDAALDAALLEFGDEEMITFTPTMEDYCFSPALVGHSENVPRPPPRYKSLETLFGQFVADPQFCIRSQTVAKNCTNKIGFYRS